MMIDLAPLTIALENVRKAGSQPQPYLKEVLLY